MTTGRPSAKQAIEVLKIHQLRRENAVIFEEVKGLREDVTNRQNALDAARKDVSYLTDEFKRMQHIFCDYGARLAQIDTGPASYAEELRTLRQTHGSLREEFSKVKTAFDAVRLQNQNAIKELHQEVTLLKDQVPVWEKTCFNSVNELQNDLANKAEKGAVAELEDKLEDFVKEIDARFESLQKISCVTDSFASPRNRHSGRCNHLHDASSPTAPVASCENDLDCSRWKPIDTQAGLRATPPAMPETLALAQAREDTDIQTPSTLRSTIPIIEAISNIIHTRPTVKKISAETPQHADTPAVPLEVAKQQAPSFIPAGQDTRADWNALNGILKLEQLGTETLAQYLARFWVVITQFPADCDIVSACLRRLVIGMVRNEEKQFVREWLRTSEWTLENVRDCILLLTRCKPSFSVSHTDSGSPDLQATVIAPAERSYNGHGFRHSSPPHAHSDRSLHTALPEGGQPGKQQNLPRQMGLQHKRVQPARAAKMQKRGNASKDNGRQNLDMSTTHQPNSAIHQLDEVGEIALNTESALTARVNPAGESVSAQQRAALKKKNYKNRLRNELKSLMNTKLIEKSMKGPTTPQKRKALHESDEDIQTASRIDHNSQSPLARRHIKPKRVPTLVPRNASKAVTVSEASDALRLPSMPVHSDNDHERESREVRSVGRTPGRENAPKLPVLTLSTSDFQE